MLGMCVFIPQVFRDQLAVEGRMAILGGFIGSWFFVFILTVSV